MRLSASIKSMRLRAGSDPIQALVLAYIYLPVVVGLLGSLLTIFGSLLTLAGAARRDAVCGTRVGGDGAGA
jgi:hypothetical protein